MSEDPTIAGEVTLSQRSTEASASARLSRGTLVGPYVVLDRIGEGGMGVVYGAFDPRLDRRVALKVLRGPGEADDPRSLRLEREARAMARLRHPHTITVHDVGEHQGRLYLAMEYVDGVSLSAWLRAEPRDWRAVVAMFVQAALGLAAAHAAGLVHRDFKPDNVMVDASGRAIVLDFGLVLAEGEAATPSDDAVTDELRARGSTSLTRTGALVGTPAYMSPEHVARVDVTAASDQFSFCIALYEALAGRRPFVADTPVQMVSAIARHEVQPFPPGCDAPRWLREVVLRGLAAAPEDRYPSMEAVVAALTPEHGARRMATVLVGVALLAVGGAWALAARGDAPTEDPAARCRAAAAAIDDDYGEVDRLAIERAFAATGLPMAAAATGRTHAALRDWSDAWSQTHVEACDATHVRGEQSDARLQARLRCLDEAREGWRTLVGELSHADARLVEGGAAAVRRLPEPDACDGVDLDDPSRTPELAPLVDEVRRELRHWQAKEIAARFDEALAGADGLVAKLGTHELPRLRAEIEYLRALALRGQDHAAESASTYRRALALAARGRDAQLQAKLWLSWLTLVSLGGEPPAVVEAMFLPAELAIEQAGGNAAQRVWLDRLRAGWLLGQGRPAECLTAARSAVDRAEAAQTSAESRAQAYQMYGAALAAVDRPTEALVALRHAAELMREAYGAGHPYESEILRVIGETCPQVEPPACAREALGRALAIVEGALGPGHTRYANVVMSLAVRELEEGDLEAARMHAERAQTIWSDTLPETDARPAIADAVLFQVALGQGRSDDAGRLLDRRIERLEASLGPEHPEYVQALARRERLRAEAPAPDGDPVRQPPR